MPQPLPWIEKHFGKFDWRPDPRQRGAVTIAGDWILHNIARITPPFPLRNGHGRSIKLIPCHAGIADQLEAVLVELRDNALTHLINSFDGCWVTRHMSWDPDRALSHHSWGIAVDVNARRFPYGSKDKQDSRLIGAFRRHGFEYGGHWSTPDAMHFEVVALPLNGDMDGMKIIVNDELVSTCGRLVDGVAEGPLGPVVAALGATLTPHAEQGKLYIYAGAQKGNLP